MADQPKDRDDDSSLRGGMRAGTGASAEGASSTADLSTNADMRPDADGGADADDDARDLDEMPGATRREPGR